MSERCVRVTARGRVQAVGFRDWLRRRAQQRNLDGWVQNLPDGSLQAVLAGDRDAVSGLINLVHQGPPGAWVESVDVADEAERPPPGFSIS